MALGSTRPLTEMSTRRFPGGKCGQCVKLTTLPPSCAVVKKSGNLNFPEPSGPPQTCNGTALPLPYLLIYWGDRGSTVHKVLRYKSEGRWLDPRWCHGIFHWHKSFWLHYGPGVDSASNRNEYQEYFLGGKFGRWVRLTTLPPFYADVKKSGNLNFPEPSGPPQTCNGTALPLPYLLTYLLTPYSTVLLEKLTGSQLVKKFRAFYGTRRFITALKSAGERIFQ
jgi:hypothetical protein